MLLRKSLRDDDFFFFLFLGVQTVQQSTPTRRYVRVFDDDDCLYSTRKVSHVSARKEQTDHTAVNKSFKFLLLFLSRRFGLFFSPLSGRGESTTESKYLCLYEATQYRRSLRFLQLLKVTKRCFLSFAFSCWFGG